jgi:hypothetical protein
MDLAGARPSGLKFNLVLVLSYFLFKHPVVLYYFCSCVNASLNATLVLYPLAVCTCAEAGNRLFPLS